LCFAPPTQGALAGLSQELDRDCFREMLRAAAAALNRCGAHGRAGEGASARPGLQHTTTRPPLPDASPLSPPHPPPRELFNGVATEAAFSAAGAAQLGVDVTALLRVFQVGRRRRAGRGLPMLRGRGCRWGAHRRQAPRSQQARGGP
jgi:hypothetical protein